MREGGQGKGARSVVALPVGVGEEEEEELGSERPDEVCGGRHKPRPVQCLPPVHVLHPPPGPG